MKPWTMPPESAARALMSLAADLPASSTLRAASRWPFGPCLTPVAPAAIVTSGRDGKTPLKPNRKTDFRLTVRRTDHALQTADIFTRHRHTPWACPARSMLSRRLVAG